MKNNFKKIVKMGILSATLSVLIAIPCFAASGVDDGSYSRHNFSISVNSVGKYSASSQVTNISNSSRYGQARVDIYDSIGRIVGSESVGSESIISSSNSITVSKSGIAATRHIYSAGYICNSPYSNSGIVDSYNTQVR